MPEHIVMTDGWPGYWGRGLTEAEALRNWRAEGGHGGTLRVLFHEDYYDCRIDPMGGWEAHYKYPEVDERPYAIVRIDRVSANGRKRETVNEYAS